MCVYICMHMQVAGLEYLPTVRVGLLNRKNLAGEGERMPREASQPKLLLRIISIRCLKFDWPFYLLWKKGYD